MSLNDFAVQLYLTLLAIAAVPIFLSWGLRRIAGKHAPVYANETRGCAEDDSQDLESDDTDWWFFWSNRDDHN
jgi:hypothetical protein